jgi:RHS repeat-associated protein
LTPRIGVRGRLWGKRRQASWANLASPLYFDTSITTRGFTGHEAIDQVGLVHMNGRVYDPELGRFLSADPFVQDAGNAQSWNRYSYVLNNPLSMTDPTGFFEACPRA